MAVFLLNVLMFVPQANREILQEFLFTFIVFVTPLIIIVSGIFLLTSLLFERTQFRRLPYGVILVLRSLLHFGIFFFVYVRSQQPDSPIQATSYFQEHSIFQSTNGFWVGSLYFLLVSFVINFLRQVHYKFGERVLRNMLLGKYHRPRVEERVFMFLDLTNSTSLTEQLGHEKYSQLIKSCFYDLTDVVLKYDAEIYQYVGDEAILTWQVKAADQRIPFIELYEAYRLKLLSKATYYQKRFGIQPFFKAGVSKGKVSVTEVGEIKREIAFHGDALNVGSRLCGQCRMLQRNLLFDAALMPHILSNCHQDSRAHGDIEVRGRREPVEVMSWQIDEAVDHPKLQKA